MTARRPADRHWSLSRWLARFAPQWVWDEAHRANAGADDSARLLAEVRRQGPQVQRMVQAHRADRAQNHYAERVAAAFAGRKDRP